MLKKSIIALLGLIIFVSACSKEDAFIPDVPVNFNSTLNHPTLNALQSPGGAVIVDGHGVAGLILFRRSDGMIVAYDRCSTVNPDQKCGVNLDNPTITVTDPCSGAKFLLNDGSAAKAPAVRPLKQYQVSINNSQITVFN